MIRTHHEPLSYKGNISIKGENIETNSKTVCKGDFKFAVQTHCHWDKKQVLHHGRQT